MHPLCAPFHYILSRNSQTIFCELWISKISGIITYYIVVFAAIPFANAIMANHIMEMLFETCCFGLLENNIHWSPINDHI